VREQMSDGAVAIDLPLIKKVLLITEI